MSGRIKIKSKDKDKRPKIDVFKVIDLRIKPEGSQKEQGGSGRAGDAREDGGQLVPLDSMT